jgi:hypothetical protein
LLLEKVCNYWLIISGFPQVFYNSDPDRNNALVKICQIQQSQVSIEFVGIAIPNSDTPFRRNPNPRANSTFALPAANQNARPYRAPYVIHWNANNNPVYYIMSWNRHLVLRCGVVFDFNIVLKEISKP